MSVGIGHLVLIFKEPYLIVGNIKEDCEVFTSTADIVSALNALHRSDLLGVYEAVFVNFSAKGEIEVAYGCESHPDLDETVVILIEEGVAPITNEYGLTVPAIVVPTELVT